MSSKEILRKFKDINGNNFLFQGITSSEEIHILQAGYICTPEGDIATIADEQDHSMVLTEFLGLFLNEPQRLGRHVFEVAKILSEYNHIIYSGPKCKNIGRKESNQGLCILLIPDIDKVTDEQLNFIQQLIESNKPRISFNKDAELVPLIISDFSNPDPAYQIPKEQLLKQVRNRKVECLEKININKQVPIKKMYHY